MSLWRLWCDRYTICNFMQRWFESIATTKGCNPVTMGLGEVTCSLSSSAQGIRIAAWIRDVAPDPVSQNVVFTAPLYINCWWQSLKLAFHDTNNCCLPLSTTAVPVLSPSASKEWKVFWFENFMLWEPLLSMGGGFGGRMVLGCGVFRRR